MNHPDSLSGDRDHHPRGRGLRLEALLLALTCLVGSSCAELQAELNKDLGGGARSPGQSSAVAPAVTVTPIQLQRYPSLNQLAAYYCPRLINNLAAQLTCGAVLGPPPPLDTLVFQIGMGLTAKNPNSIPIPMLDVLLALTLFPGQDAEGLGSVCVSMCGQSDPGCDGRPKPGACTGGGPGIHNLSDFGRAVPGLIAGLVTGQVQQELRKSTLVARGNLSIHLSFTMGIEQALRVIEKTARRFVEGMLQGQRSALAIPVSATGSVFVNLPVVGRVGVGYGPLQTTWQIQ